MKLWSLAAATVFVSCCVLLISIAQATQGDGRPFDRTFQSAKVVVDGFTGQITIREAPNGASIHVRAEGKADAMKRFDAREEGGAVLIRLGDNSSDFWWPWSLLNWQRDRYEDMRLVIDAPKGTEFDMDGIIGRVSAGDISAPLRFGGVGGGSAKFGNVMRARISVAGSMDVIIGNVSGELDAEVAGSGSITTGDAHVARLSIAGSGDIRTGAVRGGVSIESAGSGETRVGAVNGPVEIDIAGSGDVTIARGQATSFSVDIAGSGNVAFGGHANNPNIDIIGSGDVTVASYSGDVDQSIMGSGNFNTRNTNARAPESPIPPIPPVAPPAPLPPPRP
jgi:hypothetical protein